MQLRDPESDEPVTAPLPPPAATVPCGIVALSDDPLLLEALGGATGEGARVSSSPSTDRFIDQLVANAAGIALIDAASVSTSLKSFLATLREQFPQLLVLLTGPAQLQTQIGSQLADGTIFRFVHKPASSQRLRLFLDAALRQLALSPGSPPAKAAPAQLRPLAAPGRKAGLGRWSLVGIALAVLAAAVGAWIFRSQPSSPPAALPDTPDQAAAPALTPPVELAPVQSPTVAPAPAPSDTSTARDTAAREAAAALEQAQRSAQGARADQLAVYLQLARKRLTSGALIEPADDSARTYLDSALALSPDDPEVRATSLALGEALIAQFRRALAAGDAAEAQRWLAACSNYRVSGATLSQLTAQLQQLQQSQSQSQSQPTIPGVSTAPAAAATLTAPPATAPSQPAMEAPALAPPSAGAPAEGADAATPAIVNESSLTRVQFVTPSYPDEALSRGLSGWVDLEFTVSPEGKVTDVTVNASEPAGVFDRAARSALMRSRYKPVVRNGVAVTQRAHVRIRFKP